MEGNSQLGTVVPELLRRVPVVDPIGPTTVRAVQAMPSQSGPVVVGQQKEDPIIGAALKYWHQGQGPGPHERRLLLKLVLVLLRQWDRLQEQEGLLH